MPCRPAERRLSLSIAGLLAVAALLIGAVRAEAPLIGPSTTPDAPVAALESDLVTASR